MIVVMVVVMEVMVIAIVVMVIVRYHSFGVTCTVVELLISTQIARIAEINQE